MDQHKSPVQYDEHLLDQIGEGARRVAGGILLWNGEEEEIVQEVFEVLFGRPAPPDHPVAWACEVAKNKALKVLAKKRRHPEYGLWEKGGEESQEGEIPPGLVCVSLSSEDDNPIKILEYKELRALAPDFLRLIKAVVMDHAEPREQKLLHLLLRERRPWGEVARELGLEESGAKSLYFRLVNKLVLAVRDRAQAHPDGRIREVFEEILASEKLLHKRILAVFRGVVSGELELDWAAS